MSSPMEGSCKGGDCSKGVGMANGTLPPEEGEKKEEGEEELCGWGPIRPSAFQVFRNAKVFLFWLCWAGALQGMIVNGFVSVVISTIERRFDLASTETGIIASAYDIAAVLCLIPVSYFGGVGRKPRWLGFGIMILGSGSILFALPHFLTGLYEYESSRELRCYTQADANITAESLCNYDEVRTKSSLNRYKYVLIFGQLLHGVGASPLYTLGVTYLDENLKAKMTPLYVGIFYAMAIVGPALGYVMGGELLKYYADMDTIDTTSLDIGPDSPKWVGAWWVGFMISGSIAMLISFPILGFPSSLPGSAKLRAQRESEVYCRDKEAAKPMLAGATKLPGEKSTEVHQGKEVAPPAEETGKQHLGIKGIPRSLKILLTNPTFMFLNLAGASEGMLLSGFTVFTPKFIESQFSISAGWAAQLVGLATIPAGGGGTFLGGYLVKRLDLKCRGILRLCLAATSLSLVLLMVFLIQCPPVKYAGVTTDYETNTLFTLQKSNLTSACNLECQCRKNRYDPICGVNNVMFFSPCHAGCEDVAEEGTKLYSKCRCISENETTESNYTYQARDGKCESDCRYLALFLPFFALVILCTFTASMPALSATLRCVPDQQRSFALGIQWIMVRCLGTIPAPIMFGAIIDMTCRMWQGTCEGEGSCYHYNNSKMGHYLLSLAIAGKVLSCGFFSLAGFFYRPPPATHSISDGNGNALVEINTKLDTSASKEITDGSSNSRATENVTPL